MGAYLKIGNLSKLHVLTKIIWTDSLSEWPKQQQQESDPFASKIIKMLYRLFPSIIHHMVIFIFKFEHNTAYFFSFLLKIDTGNLLFLFIFFFFFNSWKLSDFTYLCKRMSFRKMIMSDACASIAQVGYVSWSFACAPVHCITMAKTCKFPEGRAKTVWK